MKNILYIIPVLFLSFLTSCQVEEDIMDTEEDRNSIALNTETYNLVYRTAMHDGSEDDEIDNNPCFLIEFPYTVNFQGVETVINTADDRQAFIESLPTDQEVIPNFPLTVINVAYQRVQVNNRPQFTGLQQACRNITSEGRAPINNARFLFPLRINSYDHTFQQTASVIFDTEEELFIYFENQIIGSVITFEYPLEILIGDNQIVSAGNRNQLRDVLRECLE